MDFYCRIRDGARVFVIRFTIPDSAEALKELSEQLSTIKKEFLDDRPKAAPKNRAAKVTASSSTPGVSA